MLSELDHEPAARAEGLDALAQRLAPDQLDEHASALIAKGDPNLLLNLGRLQLLVERCNKTDLDTALALLERGCVYDDSPARKLLDWLPYDRGEQEAIRPMLSSRLDRMLELLCSSDNVSWPAGRCGLGMLAACADPRFKGLSERDLRFVHENNESETDWEELSVAPSQKSWGEARAVLSRMSEDMPAEEQVKRMNLAVFLPIKDIEVLTTFNEYREGTIASMITELADELGAVDLCDRLGRAVERHQLLARLARAARTPRAAPADDSGTAACPEVGYLVTLHLALALALTLTPTLTIHLTLTR